MLIVYDMDEVLNNLNDVVFCGLGKERANIKYFNIYQNDNLTDTQKKYIMSQYSDSSVYKRLSPVEGADRIMNIKDHWGDFVDVMVHTHCFTDEIVDVKKEFISRYIPKLKPDKVLYRTGDDKGIVPNADIIVEDSLENLNKYAADKVRILIDKPYNKFENYPDIDSTGIIRLRTLNEVLDYIDEQVLVNWLCAEEGEEQICH